MTDKKLTANQVARWAKKKYGKDAIHMLDKTGEGREVHGSRASNAAIKILKERKAAKSARAKKRRADKKK